MPFRRVRLRLWANQEIGFESLNVNIPNQGSTPPRIRIVHDNQSMNQATKQPINQATKAKLITYKAIAMQSQAHNQPSQPASPAKDNHNQPQPHPGIASHVYSHCHAKSEPWILIAIANSYGNAVFKPSGPAFGVTNTQALAVHVRYHGKVNKHARDIPRGGAKNVMLEHKLKQMKKT